MHHLRYSKCSSTCYSTTSRTCSTRAEIEVDRRDRPETVESLVLADLSIRGYSCIASLAKYAPANDAMPREIEHLDFVARCQYSDGRRCGGRPAAWLAITRCCGASRLFCEPCRVRTTTQGSALRYCPECGKRDQPRRTALIWRPL